MKLVVSGRVLENVLKLKERVKSRLESILEENEAREASRDPHSRRKPRPCGLTIHPALGCSFGCVYCYVPTMGFRGKPRTYRLSGEQLAYALSLNPYFLPTIHGTLIAVGSVTEPFMNDEVSSKTIEYIGCLKRFYGNPIQVSTKAVLKHDALLKLREACMGDLSLLASVSTLKLDWKLEPGAPRAVDRIKLLREALKVGLDSRLFIRPIIPGVTDLEYKFILEKALEEGVPGVVAGSLRVNREIIDKLARAGVPVSAVLSRLKSRVLGDEQVAIDCRDVKRRILSEARRLGLEVHEAACSASIAAHKLWCNKCSYGPCGSEEARVSVDESGVADFLETLGFRVKSVEAEDRWVRARVYYGSISRGLAKLYFETLFKIKIIIL